MKSDLNVFLRIELFLINTHQYLILKLAWKWGNFFLSISTIYLKWKKLLQKILKETTKKKKSRIDQSKNNNFIPFINLFTF